MGTLETDLFLVILYLNFQCTKEPLIPLLTKVAKKYLEKAEFHLLPALWIQTKRGYESLLIDRRNLFVRLFPGETAEIEVLD